MFRGWLGMVRVRVRGWVIHNAYVHAYKDRSTRVCVCVCVYVLVLHTNILATFTTWLKSSVNHQQPQNCLIVSTPICIQQLSACLNVPAKSGFYLWSWDIAQRYKRQGNNQVFICKRKYLVLTCKGKGNDPGGSSFIYNNKISKGKCCIHIFILSVGHKNISLSVE